MGATRYSSILRSFVCSANISNATNKHKSLFSPYRDALVKENRAIQDRGIVASCVNADGYIEVCDQKRRRERESKKAEQKTGSKRRKKQAAKNPAIG